MDSQELRSRFLNFFEKRGHKIVPSSSLVPHDPSVLLTSAGMQQFKPYLTGELDPIKDFGTKTVTSIQKSFRTTDIEEVGDESHLTFFEMVGNFSFGSYFKEGAIQLSFEFITSKKGLDISPEKLFVTAFKGDDKVPCDDEAISIWQTQFEKVGIEAKIGERIFLYGREKNWWEAGLGPAGPDAEMFYDRGLSHDPKFGSTCHPNCDCGRFIEIGNDVFVQYNKIAEGEYEPLKQKAVDNGRGFERLVMILQKKNNIFETDIFEPLISKIKGLSSKLDDRMLRILADHLRASIFLIADGVRPSNKEAGYILRRLLRRIITYQSKYDIHPDLLVETLPIVVKKFGDIYENLKKEKEILSVWQTEKGKFELALGRGLKALTDLKKITASDAFNLYQSYGLPFEIIKEVAPQAAADLKKEEFEAEFAKHQEISRVGAEKKFGGHGLLLDTGEIKAKDEEELQKVTRLHTATHLLQAALIKVLGDEVHQMGSDITGERTRFDFSFSRKMTDEELKEVQDLVNGVIEKDLPVQFVQMSLEEAKKTGALYSASEKYPEKVKVYYAGNSLGEAFSKELCGGPHVERTGVIGKFKILKEEGTAAGVRRLRATVI